MTADNETTPATRAAELFAHGGGVAPAGRQPLRGAVRRLLLRAIRPYAYHQRLLDEQIVRALQRQEAISEREQARDGERIERLEQLARELIRTAESLRRTTADADRHAEQGLASAQETATSLERLLDELNALPYVEGDPFELFGSPVGEVMGFRGAGGDAESAGAGSRYAAFEDAFRGSAERVRRSQEPYLPLLAEHQPVLDVGCGRGELLALLAERGIAASGVDSDAGMVERCRAIGMQASQGDVNEHLEGLADGSLGTIFSAQVIEHLPYAELQRLLELARRKLAPGGLFVAETVNPHRIASLKTFWVDLTHQHPIFPEVALSLCAIAGFASGYVFAPGYDSFAQARFRAPAYAVVAEAPAA
ncbi:MAG TPA: class I SAM-dependent methyltransferase [Solirubrobacteraceae bacterium]|nr:class I SAM-dependent methyltransferase [Solirubrobacteraceae bacterium]